MRIKAGQIEQVACGGENYGGTRPCDFEWVKSLREECVSRDITFKSGMTYQGKKMQFNLKDRFGQPISKEALYVPRYAKKCMECSFKILCNGCFNCGACEGVSVP